MLQNTKQSLTNEHLASGHSAVASTWSSLLSHPKSFWLRKSRRNSREVVDALIARQWQRERAKIETIIQYNNPHYSQLKNYASQF